MEGIESSPSGRAGCSVCREKIAKGSWRYYEEVPSSQFDGEYRRHWHLSCAVERRSTGAARALTEAADKLPRLEWGLSLSQALLHRCRRHDLKVERPLWLTLDEDGWAHLLCQLSTGDFAIVTDLDGQWVTCVEGSQDDALAVLPEPVFEIAVMALGDKPKSERETRRALSGLQKTRAAKQKAEKVALTKARKEATRRDKAEAQAAGIELPKITKGSRVKIIGEDVRSTRGTKGKGVYGDVFWCGYGKTGTEKRVGLTDTYGNKYWANVADVELVVRRGKS